MSARSVGSGSRSSSSGSRSASPRKLLSRALILDAAFAIVDADDVNELTMSRLGRGLGADPSAVYRHFRNKDELLLAMADVLMDEVIASFEAVDEPIENLRRTIWAMRTAYLRRPALARAVSARFTGSPSEARNVTIMIESMQRLGYDRDEAIARTRAIAEMSLGHIIMTADVLALTLPQQVFDLDLARHYYAAPIAPTEALTRAELLAAARADSDTVFHTMIETFLRGLATDAPKKRR